jgi:hypothetical protein
MEELILFVHQPEVEVPVEVTIAADATGAELLRHPKINTLPILQGTLVDVLVFLEEESVSHSHNKPLCEGGFRHGSRVHLSRHHEVEVEVYFMHHVTRHRFSPGTRVRRVKDWAAQHFGIVPNDAAEHVLHLHGSHQAPSPATPLSALLRGHQHKLAFDLVPAKRVEG